MKSRIQWVCAVIACLGASPALAIETTLTGFGTLGYAQSNQPYTFERYINTRGTLKRDSVLAGQLDVAFTNTFSATLQAKFSPSAKNDSSWDVIPSWAFLAWKPRDDLLIRLGKQRAPFFLYSESLDLGTTYDFAHLPTEMYSMVPSSDYTGLSLSKTWNPSIGELTLDGYAGTMQTDWRAYQRDNVVVPGSLTQPGANFLSLTTKGKGLALSLIQDDNKYRVSVHQTATTIANGQFLVAYKPSFLPPLGRRRWGCRKGC